MEDSILQISETARDAATRAVEKVPHVVWDSPTRQDARALADAALAAALPHLTVDVEDLAKFILEHEPEFGEGAGAWERYGDLATRIRSDAVRDMYRKFARQPSFRAELIRADERGSA